MVLMGYFSIDSISKRNEYDYCFDNKTTIILIE
jgi:hypothetical protein